MSAPRIITSSKFQASLIGSIIAALTAAPVIFNKSLTPQEKINTAIATIISIAGLWGISIHATGQEDSAAKSAAAPQVPAVQVNSGDTQTIGAPGVQPPMVQVPPSAAATATYPPLVRPAINPKGIR